jgi:hypothetical protein
MNKTLLSIIPTTVKIAKLLSVLCIFTGFQAHAAPIITFGNLSYDGTLISGDGRTYIGLDTLAQLTYQQTQDKIANDPIYADYRIADNDEADYFINSLFGDTSDSCSTLGGNSQVCGEIPGWYDGAFGGNFVAERDFFWFEASDSALQEVGNVKFENNGIISQNDSWSNFNYSNTFDIAWLLVTDSVASNAVPTPSNFAIFVLGFAGIGFARRRRS